MALLRRRAENGYQELIFNNYKYKPPSVIRDRNGAVIRSYFYCVHRGCDGSGVKENGVFRITQIHSHNPDLTLDACDAVDRELFKVVTRSFVELGTIYENFLVLHEDITRLWDRNQKIRQMSYWRTTMRFPNINNSMADLNNLLFMDEWIPLRTCGTNFLDVDLYDDEVLLFKHPEVMEHLGMPRTLVLNVTDTMLPSGLPIGLIITVQAIMTSDNARKKNRAVPCMWFLLRGKTANALRVVARSIHRNFGHFVNNIQTNGDADLDNELNNYDLHPTISLFSFAKIILRKARELEMDMAEDGKRILIHSLIILSLLPATSIPREFEHIAGNNPECDQILNYYRNYWIRDNIDRMCFFNNWDALAETQRTYERVVNNQFRNNPEPTIFEFIGFLVKANEKIIKDIQSFNGGEQPKGDFMFIMKTGFNQVAVKNVIRDVARTNGPQRVIGKLLNLMDELLRDIASNHNDFPANFREMLETGDEEEENVQQRDVPTEEPRVDEQPIDPADNEDPTIVACIVCQIKKPNQVLINCGHLLCGACSTKIIGNCPLCRQKIVTTNHQRRHSNVRGNADNFMKYVKSIVSSSFH